MKILALDSATERMALALLCGDASQGVNAEGGALSSQQMIPGALALLAGAGLRVTDLDAVAFGCGPGAFTGLRTAVAVAQGLAFGAGLPVLSIDSLLIVAEDWRAQRTAAGLAAGGTLWVTMDARMDEIYAAAYRHDGQRWQIEQAPALYDLAHLQARWHAAPPRHVAGSALTAFAGRLLLGDADTVPVEIDRAAALGRLAAQAWRDGARLDPEQALPLYLRDKVALTTAERAALRAAAVPS